MYLVLYVTLLCAICNAETETSNEENDVCVIRNGYTKVEGSCDSYVECVDYKPSRHLCPDGLNFNPNIKWPMYACSYPADVSCVGGSSQPAKPTADCPRQFGFFRSPLAGANNCEQYRFCSEGYAFDMYCPLGLAFDQINARCDWPDLVPGCGSDVIYRFNCPAPVYDIQGNPLTVNFRHESSCVMFYSCYGGRGRLLSCDPGLAFDSRSGRCVDEERSKCIIDAKIVIPASDKDVEVSMPIIYKK